MLPERKIVPQVYRWYSEIMEYVTANPDAKPWANEKWLGERTEFYCACGSGPLRRYEAFNRKCDKCSRAEIDKLVQERTHDVSDRRMSLGIPKAYVGCSFTAWKGRVPAEVLSWRDSPNGNLYLHGGPGAGKTHLATAVLISLAEEDKKYCAWASALMLPDQLAAEMTSYDKPVWRRLTTCGCLVLDDLGAQRDTPWADDSIARLVTERFNNSLPTIFTSNWQPEDWTRRPEVAFIASRVLSGTTKEIRGADRRLA